VYNRECHCVKSVNRLKSNTLPIKNQGGAENAQNISTQEASEKEGAWLQKENEDCGRQKRSQEKTRKRQKETDLLIGAFGLIPKTVDDVIKMRLTV